MAFRAGLAAIVALAAVLRAGTAAAIDKVACVSAAEEGQRLRKHGMLLAAREKLLVCAAKECPGPVSQDCTRWLGDIERGLASVVVSAQGPRGETITELRVLVDGKLLTDHTTSTPIPVDPGVHVVRYERDGSTPVEDRIALTEGERGRALFVRFTDPAPAPAPPSPPLVSPLSTSQTPTPSPPPEPPPSAERTHALPATVWVLGGVGVLGLGGFTYFGLSGKSDQNDLGRTCAPYCTDSQVAPVQNKFLAADVFLGVGVVALAAAVWIALENR